MNATTATRQPPAPHPLMTRAEFARALRVDPTTVDSWRRDGHLERGVDWIELPAGGFRYRRTALRRILAAA